ncbi:MAG: hypothetical protein J6Y94_02460 [Bacteriovoracaceae bacterium]|nr:hypothetical protein [Bacteriovoracaceae bacterium]
MARANLIPAAADSNDHRRDLAAQSSSPLRNVIKITNWPKQIAAFKAKRIYQRYLKVLQLDQLLSETSFLEHKLEEGPITLETIQEIRHLLSELRHRISDQQQAHQLQAAYHRADDKIKTFLA